MTIGRNASERSIVAAIVKALRTAYPGIWISKTHGSQYSRAGIPDLLVCAPGGRFVALEVKRPGKKPTKLQEIELAHLKRAGAVAAVVTNPGDAVKALRLC